MEDFESVLKVFLCAILNPGKDCSNRLFITYKEATDKDFGRKPDATLQASIQVYIQLQIQSRSILPSAVVT